MAASAPASSSDKDLDWIAPIGVLAVCGVMAKVFVGTRPFKGTATFPQGMENDNTAQVLHFAVAAGALAVIAWGLQLHWQGRPKYRQLLRDRLLLALGVCGLFGYFNFGNLHFGNFVHIWDTYHYVMGAKYFPENGYDKMYDCAMVANAENGRRDEVNRQTYTDLRTNVIVTTAEIMKHPERCKENFSTARWDEYKKDIAAFRGMVGEQRWREIHLDHGYNATPVWTLAGYALTNGTGTVSLDKLTRLNLIDPIYLILTVLIVWWAFGARAFAIASIVLGTHFANRFYWTGGAFLRHDWVFYFVASICLLKKERPVLAGAAFAYTVLLRLFPGLAAAGVAVAAFEYFRQNKKLDPRFLRYVAAGAVTSLVLVGLSFRFGGIEVWQRFAQNTVKHANTPLTNHMGLRTILSWDPNSIGMKTAGGFRQPLVPTPNNGAVELHPLNDTAVKIPFEGPYTVVLRGTSPQPSSYTLQVDGAPQGQPLEFNPTLRPDEPPLSRTVTLPAGEHRFSLVPLASDGVPLQLSVAAVNRISTLDGWWYWKALRLANWHSRQPLMWLAFLAGLYLVWLAVRHTGTDPYFGAALGVGFIVIGAELTNYYYCFLLGIAVLHQQRREVGLLLTALCTVSQVLNWGPFAWMSHWLDEQYVTMSAAALLAVVGIWWVFTKYATDALAPPEEPLVLFEGEPARPDKSAKKKKNR